MHPPALKALRQGLHLSYSQIQTYLGCPLRYRFRYLEERPPQHESASRLLGSAIHNTLAQHYLALQATGRPEAPEALLDYFAENLRRRLARARAPLRFKSDATDAKSLQAQGEALLRAFWAEPLPPGWQVVAVERPLSARLVGPEGNPADWALVGVVDLLLRDGLGRLVALDHKTARQPIDPPSAERDLQLSTYALLLRRSGELAAGESLACGFQVLRKLKTPRLERVMSRRDAASDRRLARLAAEVWAAVGAQLFYPSPGWACADCPYEQACRLW